MANDDSGTSEHVERDDAPDESRLLLGALVPDPHNRRSHPTRNREMIAQSLREVGPGRSIVIDERGEIIAGNGVVQSAPDAGITKVRIVEAAADELIAVRRRDLTPEQKRAMAIYDNRTSELAEWNHEQLSADRAEGIDLRPYWSETEEHVLLGEGVRPDWAGMPEFDQQDETAFRTIKVHFASQADVDAFALLLGQSVTDKTRYLWYPEAQPKTVTEEFTGSDDAQQPEQ